jgi:hypothetical protein
MGRAGFVADEDVADAFIAEQRIIDRKYRAAGIAEHEFDALGDQAFDQDFSAAALAFTTLFPCLQGPRKPTVPSKLRPGMQSPAREPSKTAARLQLPAPGRLSLLGTWQAPEQLTAWCSDWSCQAARFEIKMLSDLCQGNFRAYRAAIRRETGAWPR